MNHAYNVKMHAYNVKMSADLTQLIIGQAPGPTNS
jgi:hypothetical protein